MLQNTLTLSTVVFDKITTSKNESTYSAEAVVLTEPQRLRISHNIRKTGVVDTLVQSEHHKRPTIAGSEVLLPFSSVRVQFKMSYNPVEGREDIIASLNDQRAKLNEFIDAEITSLINREV